jgi:hypothetical protein
MPYLDPLIRNGLLEVIDVSVALVQDDLEGHGFALAPAAAGGDDGRVPISGQQGYIRLPSIQGQMRERRDARSVRIPGLSIARQGPWG